jgi:hypothetical protein
VSLNGLESQRLEQKLGQTRLRLAELEAACLGRALAADIGDPSARREIERLSTETEKARREIAELVLAVTQWQAAECEAAALLRQVL